MADSKKNVFFIGGYSYTVDKSTPLCRREDFFHSATLYQSPNGRFFVVENDAADTITVKVLSKSDAKTFMDEHPAGKARCKIRHPMAQGGTPWHQMQRDSTLFRITEQIPDHQCCIPLHRSPHSALLQNGPPHGLMQAHRERHKPTSRKRGALLEQYNPLSEHGNRQKSR